MASIKDRLVEIVYSLKDKFTGQIAKVTGGMRDIEYASDRSARKIEQSNQRAASSYDGVVGAIGRVKLGILSVIAVIGGATSAIGKWTAAAAIQERAETKLATTLQNLSGATKEQIASLKEQAAALQELTGYGDEQTISAQAMLGTFRLNAEQISVLTPRLLDMAEAARRAGNAEVDLETISIALGKSFTSGIGSLSRYGIAMTEAQKESFKLADQSGKVALLAEILDSNFMGLAESVGNTYEGALRKADAAQGDLLETLGKQFTQNQAWLKLTSSLGKAWTDTSTGITESTKNIAVVVTALAKLITGATYGIRVAWNGVQTVFRVTAAAIVESVASISDAFGFLTFGEASDRLHRFAADMRGTTREILNGVRGDWDDIKDATNDLLKSFEDTVSKADSTADGLSNLGDEADLAADNTRDLAAEQDRLSEALDGAAAAARAEIKELNAVTEEGEKTRQKFSDLTDEIAGTQKKAENFSFTDVVRQLTNARRALNEGDFDGAVSGAEKAGEMLREMKDRGEESTGVLTALALKLEEVVKSATEGKTQKELVDAEASIAEVEKIKEKIATIVEGPVELKLDVDMTPIDQLRSIQPIVIPVRYEIVGGPIPTFNDGVDVRHESDKRGYKP